MDKKNKVLGLEINEIDEKKKKGLANRLIVAAILILTGVPAYVLGGWIWFAFILFFLVIAVYEILTASQKKYHWTIWVFTYILVISYVYWFLIKYNTQSLIRYQDAKAAGVEIEPWTFSLMDHFDGIYVSIYAIILSIAFYCLCAIVNKEFDWFDACYLFAMALLIGIGFQSLLFVRYYPFALVYQDSLAAISGKATHYPDYAEKVASGYFASPTFKYWGSIVFFTYVLVITVLNDTFAYFTGMLFGKHKMNERISPNKTWEGFFGGWILSGIGGMGFAMICDICGYPLLPSMAIFSANSGWYWVLIMSFTTPLLGVLGDFTFSMIKRHYGFKDFSHILGAHGGVLDRADSLIFTYAFAAVFAIFTSTGWRFWA